MNRELARDKFEDWAKNNPDAFGYCFDLNRDQDGYSEENVQDAWESWLACWERVVNPLLVEIERLKGDIKFWQQERATWEELAKISGDK
jgi:hypothetical protein